MQSQVPHQIATKREGILSYLWGPILLQGWVLLSGQKALLVLTFGALFPSSYWPDLLSGPSGLTPSCTSQFTASASSGFMGSPWLLSGSLHTQFFPRGPREEYGDNMRPAITPRGLILQLPPKPPIPQTGDCSLAWPTGVGSYLLVLGAGATPQSSRAGPEPSW